MRSQASGEGRGLGAGAHPGGEEASATREKTRSVGSECVSERGDYVFDRAMKNPTPATKKDSIIDWVSAMEFCFIYGKCLVFALLPLNSAVLRAFFLI